MYRTLFVGIVMCSLLVSGCTPTNGSNSSSNTFTATASAADDGSPSTWSVMSSQDKIKTVQQDLDLVKYTGNITAAEIASSMDQWYATMSDGSAGGIRSAVNITLSQDTLNQEESKIDNLPDAKQLSELQSFLTSGADETYLSDSDKSTLQSKITDLQNAIAAAKAQEEKKKSCPLKIVNAYVQKDSIGTPQAYVVVKNNGQKSINAYKVAISCYNSFGEPVIYVGTNSNIYTGIAQDNTIAPGETFGDNYYWLLALQDTTTKITAEITEVHFTDGTTWSLNV